MDPRRRDDPQVAGDVGSLQTGDELRYHGVETDVAGTIPDSEHSNPCGRRGWEPQRVGEVRIDRHEHPALG